MEVTKAQSVSGQAFNKGLTDAPLNNSLSKASFSFSKADRFNMVRVNEKGYAVTVLGKEKHNRTVRNSPSLTRDPSPSYNSTVKRAGFVKMPKSQLPRGIN